MNSSVVTATAVGRATGRDRALLVALLVALVLAAAADAATGYDGPGPFLDLAAAAVTALVPWRWTPALAAAFSVTFLVGGLRDTEFAGRLVDPGSGVEWVAGWLQVLGFVAAAICGIALLVRVRRATGLALAGMGVGIVGLLVQWVADPAKFAGEQTTFGLTIPPGILFVLACAAVVLVTRRWWWHALPAVAIALWIVGAGTLAGQLTPNLVSPNPGTVAGTLVMAIGLVGGAAAGVRSMVTARRAT